MTPEPDNNGTRLDLDAVLADYMHRLDRGERPDHEALVNAHPGLADELRKYFSVASAVERLAVGTVDITADFTDRKHSATVAFSCSDAASPTPKELDAAPRVTMAGERFRKLRSHALGGLGEVSLAQDEQLNRVVALKELQDKYTSDSGKKTRFLLEGEVTGSLEHPGIVPVYAMGHDAAGRPFYVMRFIRGESLREAIRRLHAHAEDGDAFSRNSMEFRQLLNRVVDVCNAIAFAHDRGVLHRDIKPENVMLGKFGEALVVDWGMARVVGRPMPESSEETLLRPPQPKHFSATREGSALGTPAYMSPEVAAGKLDQVGPPCDIFSLGATLYCLLTNRPPLHADSLTELLRKAERCDFPTAIEVNPRIPKALNAICCRALALDPAARYVSTLELASDIERWLADEAVLAYREPLPERAFRWVRRHRSWALAGAASVCAVTLVAIIAAGLINESRRQAVALANENAALATRESAARKEAIERFAQSRRTVDKWLTGFTEAVEYYPGVQEFRDRMLQQAAENYSQFAKQVSNDPELELERGRTLVRLGDLRHSLLQVAAAAESYAAAEKVFANLPLRGVTDGTAQLETANVSLRQGILASETGEFDTAEQRYAAAIQQLQALSADDLDSQRITLSLADAHASYGVLLTRQGKLDAGEQQIQRAIELQSGLVRAAPADLKLAGPLANTRERMGQLLVERGAGHDAVSQFEQVVAHWDRLVAVEPDHPKPLQSRAAARINLASAWRLLGHYQKEAEAYRAAITDYEALRSAIPDFPIYRENIALTQTDLGQLLFEMGRPQEAVDLLVKTREELKELADTHPKVIRCREELAVCLDNLGQAQADLGLLKDAFISHETAETLLATLVQEIPDEPAYQERCAICRSHVGQIQAALGNTEQAIDSLKSAITQLEQLRTSNKDLASAASALAIVHGRLGDVLGQKKGALEQSRDSYAIATRTWQEALKLSPMAEYFHRAAWFLTMCPSDAKPDTGLALECARLASEAAPENGHYLGTLAAAEFRAGNTKHALELFDRASKLQSFDQGRDQLIRALCQAQLGRHEDARAAFADASAWIAKNRPGNAQLRLLLAEVEHTFATRVKRTPIALPAPK